MINLKDIPQNNSFDSLPENWYTIRVEKAELADSKNGPNTMIKVQFGVVSPAKYSNRKVWNNFNLGSKSLLVLKNFLEAGGIDTDNMANISEEDLINTRNNLVGDGYLEPSTTITGKPSNKITNYRKTSETTKSSGQIEPNLNAAMFK